MAAPLVHQRVQTGPPLIGEAVTRLALAGDANGEAAFFLPGSGWTGAEGASLGELVPAFSWHLLDLPGTGGTDPISRANAASVADWLRSVAAKLGTGKFHLAGHSQGGYLAAVAAPYLQDSLRSLVLIDGGVARFPLFPTLDLGAAGYAAPLAVGLDWLVGGALIANRPGPPVEGHRPEDPSFLIRWLGEDKRSLIEAAAADCPGDRERWDTDTRAAMRWGFAMFHVVPTRVLSQVHVPTLAIDALWPSPAPGMGRKALAALQRRAKVAARRLSALSHVTVWEAPTGHYVFWEDPPGTREQLRAFYAATGKAPSK